ncbi:MAG TPA: helix-turn-helix transcriptional regulator [Oscillospiraceae bacterium]|nr:helix-turn-helix transcriptional regulator [Oscillospiraceae bacterium]
MTNYASGRLIAELRKAKNMTQKELAAYLNVSDKAVSKWERGENYPEVSILPQLANKLEITVDELLSGKIAPQTASSADLPEAEQVYAYSCLLEDARLRYNKHTLTAYAILAIGILTGSIILNNILPQVAAVALALTGTLFYYFANIQYQNGRDRFVQFAPAAVTADGTSVTLIKYGNTFISTTAFLLLSIATIAARSPHNLFIQDNYLLIDKIMPFPALLLIIIINLTMYAYFFNGYSRDRLQKISRGDFVKILSSFCVSLILAALVLSVQLQMIITKGAYNSALVNNVTLLALVFAVLTNFCLLFFNNRRTFKKFLHIFVVSMLQAGLLICAANQYVVSTMHYDTNVLGLVYTGNIITVVMLALTIFHFAFIQLSRKKYA